MIFDNNFTHCHPAVIDAVFLYCFTIGRLIRSEKSDLKERIDEVMKETAEVCKAECGKEVNEWFDLALLFAETQEVYKDLLDPSRNIGFLKHAFVLSYYFLKILPTKSYSECMAKTMSFAGDTDTNGAIVGGMLGACVGRSELPKDYVEKVLNCGQK